MRRMTKGMFAVLMIMFGGIVAVSAQGSERARERRGFDAPPGLERKAVPVPDTGSTLTLLSLALGSGLLLRGWASRRSERSGPELPR